MKRILKTSLIIVVLANPFTLQAQGIQKPIEVTMGTIKTDLKQNAINFGLSYLKSLDSLWEKQDFLINGNKSLLLLTPDIHIESGNADAFSSISVKLTALTMLFDTLKVAGQVTPNTAKTFQTFPVSLGMETSNEFNRINGIVEIGWVPWYQASERKIPGILKKTKFGLFFQGGYKFEVEKINRELKGGEVDQSKEKINNAIFRIKGSFGIDTKSLFHFSGVGVGFVGSTDGWYNFLNSEIYYSIIGKLRLYLTENEDKFFNFFYQKGSGAPNFNQGDQYGIGLTVTF